MTTPPPRLIFAGTPHFAVPSLQALLDAGYAVEAIYTQPDRPAGRGRSLRASPLKVCAAAAGIPVYQPVTLRDAAVQAELAALKPDLLVVAAYGLILPPVVLAIPRLGCVNVHASLLPRWRGAAPIHWALLAGDAKTGVSLMRMEAGLDTGPVFARAVCPIPRGTTGGELSEQLAALGAETLLATLPDLLAGRLTPEPQDEARATYAPKLDKTGIELNWNWPAAELERRVLAFNPYPVARHPAGRSNAAHLAGAGRGGTDRRPARYRAARGSGRHRGRHRLWRAAAHRGATARRSTAAGRGVSECPPADGSATGRGMNVRAIAAQVLGQVLGEGRSLAMALPPALDHVAPRDRGLLRELCYGVCRWQPELQMLLDRLLNRPLDPREPVARALLLTGLYQLRHLRIPDHAAVAETVTAARQLHKSWAASLINAVLRSFLRRRVELQAQVEADAEARTAHPRWLLERLQRDWPDDWPAIVAANNARPPFTLRVNRLRSDRDDYRAQLAAAGQVAEPVAAVATALVLAEPVEPAALPGFAEGRVSVQDAAAQLAAPLLAVEPGMRVLDACAAPGGKTAHLLECAPELELTALDRDAERLERVRDHLNRLRLEARLVVGDAGQPADWWDGVPYDRILVDAPCSATGVIRRHPDIKLLRRETDIAALADRQQAILTGLWPLLRPGGWLLYATCSVLRRENEQVVAALLAAQPEARERAITADWGRALAHGRQILPGEAGMDGFYYAVLVKPADEGATLCPPAR